MTEQLNVLALGIIKANLILVYGLGISALIEDTETVKQALNRGISTLTAMLFGGIILWCFGGFAFRSPAVQVGYYLSVGLVSSVLARFVLSKENRFQACPADSALVGLLLLLASGGLGGADNVLISLGGGLGYSLVLVIVAVLRGRLARSPLPKALRGAPIILITAGLLGIALLGFRF